MGALVLVEIYQLCVGAVVIVEIYLVHWWLLRSTWCIGDCWDLLGDCWDLPTLCGCSGDCWDLQLSCVCVCAVVIVEIYCLFAWPAVPVEIYKAWCIVELYLSLYWWLLSSTNPCNIAELYLSLHHCWDLHWLVGWLVGWAVKGVWVPSGALYHPHCRPIVVVAVSFLWSPRRNTKRQSCPCQELIPKVLSHRATS